MCVVPFCACVAAQVDATISRVQALVGPIEAACAAELQRLQAAEAQRQALVAQLAELQRRTADVE